MNRQLSIVFGLMLTIFGVLFLIFLCNKFSFITHHGTMAKKHRVLLVVLDAFRHDYIEVAKSLQIDLPNINRMIALGARSMKVTPAYPSVTFPNHQTLVTGLYTPYHGITYNNFNDSSMNFEQFSMDNQSSLNEARWYAGYPDPIWVSCEKNRYCKSGSMLWPNTDAVVNGYRSYRQVGEYTALNQVPNVVYPYDRRVTELIGWMKKDLIDFGLLYFDEPDMTSHSYGPMANETLNKVKEMDGWIGRLLGDLENEDLLGTTDVILTGDHGMTDMSLSRVIDIDKFVNTSWYKSTYSYPVGIIYPNEGMFESVFNAYSNASEHIKVYRREELPKELHYSDNPRRISPIVTVVDLGWFVNCSHYNKTFSKGNHGYSPYEDDMKSTLLAMGPSFKHTVVNATKHVDLYSLMMHLLGLRANSHNGSFARISPILTDDAMKWRSIEDKFSPNVLFIFVFLMALLQVVVSLSFTIWVVLSQYKNRDSRSDFEISYRKQKD